MIKDQTKNKRGVREITAESLEANPSIDRQGLTWTHRSREAAFDSLCAQVRPHFNVIGKKPQYDQNFVEGSDILRFRRFIPNKEVIIKSFQLRRSCQVPANNRLLYTTFPNVVAMSLADSTKKVLLPYLSDFLSYSQKSGILAGTHDESCLFLANLFTGKTTSNFNPLDNQVINQVLFFENSSPLFAVGGNQKYINCFDLEKLARASQHQSLTNVNDLDYDERTGLLAFAMDHVDIQLCDRRGNEKAAALLKGHQDYNFAIKFLRGPYLATGGQDITTRIWDIRAPQKEVLLLEGNKFAVSAFAYKRATNTLFAIESFGYICAYRLRSGIAEREVIEVFGHPSGICMNPSQDHLYVALAFRAPGVMEFSI